MMVDRKGAKTLRKPTANSKTLTPLREAKRHELRTGLELDWVRIMGSA